MSKSVIVMYPRRHGGGLGDFLRCALSFYAFARRNDVPFYIDYSESGLLQHAFEGTFQYFEELCAHLEITEEVTLYDTILSPTDPYIQNMYSKILTKPARYNFRSNIFGFETTESILAVVDDFLKYVFVPSVETVRQINNLETQINTAKRISVHVRCGDSAMINYDNPFFNNDKRYLVNEDAINELGKKLNKILSNIMENGVNQTERKIIIHSDSEVMRDRLSQLCGAIPINSHIQHTAHENIDNDQTYFNSTVAEFFIMMRSELIIQITYSGFSHWAAILGKTQFVYLNDDKHIKACNYGNKINI